MLFNEKDYFYVKSFYCNNDLYFLCVTKKYEIILAKSTPVYDPFLKNWEDEEPTTTRIESLNKASGMLVYKNAVKYFIEYLYSHKPPYFCYSTDGNVSRKRLYSFFSNLAEKHGYTCYHQDGCIFNFIRNNGSLANS